MLVSGNMTPQKMGRKVGKKIYFKKKFCPIFYFMTHLFPTAQLKNRGVEAQGFKAMKFTESAAFCRVGRVTGNNNKFLLGLTKTQMYQY